MSRTAFDQAHSYGATPFACDLPVRSIVDAVMFRARLQPDLPYLTAFTPEGREDTLSYRALEVLSRRVAGWLQGLGSGNQPIGLLPLNDIPSVLAIVGALRAGVPLLLLNPYDPVERLRQQCSALGVHTLLRSPDVSMDAATMLPAASQLDEPRVLGTGRSARDGALYFGTSGSTAASKLVEQSAYNAAVNAEAIRRHHGLKRGDRLLGCLPIHHVNGLHFTVLGTIIAGCHAVMPRGFDPFTYGAVLERTKPRLASVVPTILEALSSVWRAPALPAEFRYFVSAAAPLSQNVAQAVMSRLGARVLQGYGLTETVNFSTTMPQGLSDQDYRKLMLDAEIPSIGSALWGNDVSILDPTTMQPVRPGEIGEICMRGHNVMSGYANNPEATAEAFRGGWFHSCDLGFERVDNANNTRFMVITGRIKNIAKVRGQAVSLDEMDRVLRRVPEIEDVACVALPTPLVGEEVTAAIVLRRHVDEGTIRAILSEHFSSNVMPARIVFLERLPRTPTGKILRAQLAEEMLTKRNLKLR